MKFIATITQKEIENMKISAYTDVYVIEAQDENEATKRLYEFAPHVGTLQETLYKNGFYIATYSEYDVQIQNLDTIKVI